MAHYFRCEEPTLQCPHARTREVQTDGADVCHMDNPNCERYRLPVPLLVALRERSRRLFFGGVGVLMLILVALLQWTLFDGSRFDPSEQPYPAQYRTTLRRYPTMNCQACDDGAHVNQPFSVLFSLTRDRKTPEARIDEQHADADGAARLQLPKDPDLPDEDAWEIQADLTAQGFALEGPDSRTIRLPRSGDSDLARFRLTPKSIDGDQAQRQIQISLWHRGTFLGQVSRDLTVYADRPAAAPEKPHESGSATPKPESKVKPSAISAPAPQSLLSRSAPGPARPGPKQEPQRTPAPISIIDKEPPDLTVFLNYPAPGTGGEGTVTIHSRYQQSVTAALPAADGLEDWLRTLSLGVAQGAPRRPVQLSDTGPGTDEDPRRTIDRMQSLGEDAWRRFAPEVFQNAYWDLRERLGSGFDSIQIITNQPLVPWELMRPSRKGETDDFLGTAFRIGRWHLNRTAGVLRSPEQQQVLRDLIAIAPDYAGSRGLPAVSEELRGLARFTGYRRLDARYESLRDLGLDPRRPRGIIHFAGHGEAAADAPATRYHIKLEDGDLDPLAWRALFKPSSAHPLVFLNACEIGQARAVGFFVEGWAPAVLETGASGFVGGLWPLPDDSAAAFAIRFYADLVGRLERNGEASVAEVLRQTRTRFRETGDPTYLAYVFYGDPELRFQAAAPTASGTRAKP